MSPLAKSNAIIMNKSFYNMWIMFWAETLQAGKVNLHRGQVKTASFKVEVLKVGNLSQVARWIPWRKMPYCRVSVATEDAHNNVSLLLASQTLSTGHCLVSPFIIQSLLSQTIFSWANFMRIEWLGKVNDINRTKNFYPPILRSSATETVSLLTFVLDTNVFTLREFGEVYPHFLSTKSLFQVS